MLKHTVAYYLMAFIPAIVLFDLAGQINSNVLVTCLFTYLLIYRPILDRLRLIDKGILTREKALKLYFPGLAFFYFKELYLP